MDTKEQLVSHVKGWIQVDNEIAELQKAIKLLREEKKNLSTKLVEVMKTNEIDCFDVNDGKLVYSKSTYKKPISKKLLYDSLKKYFKDKTDVIEDLNDHILNSREETLKESIKRRK